MADIGPTLREARMRARIDITEVETRTKIRAKYLRAIENEEWDLLPGPVYAKSFLRTYGDFLGLDSRMLVDEYRRRYERPSDHDLRPLASLGRERERSARGPLVPPWLLIAGVLIAVVVALYTVGTLSSSNHKTQSPAGVHANKPRQHHRKHHHKTQPPPTPTTVKLQLVPTAPVYVCLINGAGAKLINQQTFAPGQTIPTEKASKLLLTLGNASVQMKVNGRSVAVSPSANPIRFMIKPSGAHQIPLSTSPTCP
jgi:cytoskeletal protein RodZ